MHVFFVMGVLGGYFDLQFFYASSHSNIKIFQLFKFSKVLNSLCMERRKYFNLSLLLNFMGGWVSLNPPYESNTPLSITKEISYEAINISS